MSRLTTAILLLFLTAGIAFFLIVPQWRKVGEVRSAIQDLSALHAELTELAASRDALVAEYNAIPEADLEKLRAIAPAGREASAVLTDFEALAVKHLLSLDQVDFTGNGNAPGALAPARRFGTLPVALSLRGSYENFREFLLDLEHNLRLADVDEVTITTGQGKETPITLKGAIYYRQ